MQKKAQLMDATGMRRSITRMAHEILERNKGLSQVILVGIERRGVHLANRIADRLLDIEGVQPEVFALDPRPYRDDVPSSENNRIPLEGFPVEDKVVVLVDDVLYTGRTVRAAMDAIMTTGRAKMIQLAVLADRGHRELPIRPDYVGKNVPTARDEAIEVMLNELDEEDSVWITGQQN
ncbi:bifunctional pyr operon transcriptional regulator/uracil phosphoribosyltransferase PyrR [Alicyclobacillus sp. SO9]|uniref:bifunctional pyr operon transcriptional regulator/uracil phosphoribosyltransferase PyrR n=1 Tax=Alicyclobacillus sp. SO9 TaxID=2665646 RepID=UPI0018E8419E|nr:bifunctional pyr operon transcriptional regulator/uracil phosphoribosyltransferase PyrR [Alicyclobacillus sp. SO9]QQE80724.1 bifunctional pyr operon transcriptional regulator/uracil phosphoribosyltransferase PyrR [Alicyclobacillus sp. SO9]